MNSHFNFDGVSQSSSPIQKSSLLTSHVGYVAHCDSPYHLIAYTDQQPCCLSWSYVCKPIDPIYHGYHPCCIIISISINFTYDFKFVCISILAHDLFTCCNALASHQAIITKIIDPYYFMMIIILVALSYPCLFTMTFHMYPMT